MEVDGSRSQRPASFTTFLGDRSNDRFQVDRSRNGPKIIYENYIPHSSNNTIQYYSEQPNIQKRFCNKSDYQTSKLSRHRSARNLQSTSSEYTSTRRDFVRKGEFVPEENTYISNRNFSNFVSIKNMSNELKANNNSGRQEFKGFETNEMSTSDAGLNYPSMNRNRKPMQAIAKTVSPIEGNVNRFDNYNKTFQESKPDDPFDVYPVEGKFVDKQKLFTRNERQTSGRRPEYQIYDERNERVSVSKMYQSDRRQSDKDDLHHGHVLPMPNSDRSRDDSKRSSRPHSFHKKAKVTKSGTGTINTQIGDVKEQFPPTGIPPPDYNTEPEPTMPLPYVVPRPDY